ncbi:hypothetical protein OEZ86_012406 [Tetradesmus obliquus]|nr:hypothetical protein OEZ86_012406 [Tetradesmus obliquus]
MAAAGQPMDDNQYRAWKTQLVPLLYDWFSNHNLTWPSQACRWGPRLEDHTFRTKYRMYISEQTNPADVEPPKLLVADVDLVKPRVASTEAIATWNELSRCPYIKEAKTLVHPGEVNKIREVPQHPEVIVTHTDAPELYVWNTQTQPNAHRDKDTKKWVTNSADVKLVGHEKDALFPLATCSAAPLVASGGTDKLLLLWDLRDVQDSLLAKRDKDEAKHTTELQHRQKLRGHKKTVEDLVFQPGSSSHLISVGDDAQMLLWDTGASNSPVQAVEKAHGSCDVHTVDWSGLQEHLIVTGAADGSLKVWDRRKLPANGAAPDGTLHTFAYHSEAIMRVEWHPSERGVFASGGEDHLVVVWSLERAGAAAAAAAAAGSSKAGKDATPPEVLFKHVGHRAGKVVDFQWCPGSPWTMMSVSDDTAVDSEAAAGGAGKSGGGTLQLWRISDLLYLPEEQVVAELEAHREWILTGKEAPKQAKKPAAKAQQQQDKDKDKAAAAGDDGAGGSADAAADAKQEQEADADAGAAEKAEETAAGAEEGAAAAVAEEQRQEGDAMDAEPAAAVAEDAAAAETAAAEDAAAGGAAEAAAEDGAAPMDVEDGKDS